MPSATFQFNPGKMADAFEYVRDCFEWLAAGGGDLESIAHELKLEKFARGAEHLLSDIRSTQNRLAPVNQLPPELLGAIFAYLKTPHIPAKSSIEFIKCKWPVAQSICRHWRFAAVHTPVLWSFIQVDSYFISFQNRLDFVSAIFARSGALPLDLRLRGDGAAFSNNKSLLSSNSWRIQELHARGPSSFFLESCLQEANQLETLVIVNGPQHVSLWRIPRLRTLVASNFTGWHGGVFRTLRHLILEDQPFNAQLLRGLHSLLTLNPLLEDLVIKDVWGSLELETTLDALPSVNMPGLRRISIQCPGGFSAVEGLVSKKLVLQEGHARFYGFPVPAHHLFPLRKLFITAERRTGCVVGTDGRSGFCLEARIDLLREQCAALSWRSHIQELWLWTGGHFMHATDDVPFDWTGWFKEMNGVKKIVLTHEIYSWLDYISQHDLFPGLVELQLHDPQERDAFTVYRFLAKRADSNPIQTLRFAQDPRGLRKSLAFLGWKENMSMFTQYVPHVVLEDKQPLRMELPAACTTSSTVHGYWPSWEKHMYSSIFARQGPQF